MSLTVRIRKKLSHFTLDVSFQTDAGFTVFLGASGCGKSMTLKCIAGLEKPDEGYIELNGRVLFDSQNKIDLSPQQRHVGYLFQNYALFPNMTVRENIMVSRHKDRAEAEAELREYLKLLQLEGYEDKYPAFLSGGQQQRTALARILMSRPEILLLDEPFTALDAHLRERLQMEMKELLEKYGQQVIMVTHDRDEAYRMGQDAGVLDEGRLTVFKPVKELYADPEYVNAARLIGCKNITAARCTGEHSLHIPEWGMDLQLRRTVPRNLCAVGIKAHYFGPDRQFVFPVQYCGTMEDPFETIVRFRFRSQLNTSSDIWWKIPESEKTGSLPDSVGFNEEDLLLLREETESC